MVSSLSFRSKILALTGVATITTLLCGSYVHADETLNIGYQKGSGVLSVIREQGALQKELARQGIHITWNQFPAGPQLLEALNAGSIDFGATGAPPPVFAQAAGINFYYVGAVKVPVNGEAIIVPQGSSITSVSQLKGKRIALQKGSSSNFQLLALLQKAGLSFSDITPAYLAPADARAAFTNDNVDAWVIWEPYLSSAEHDLHARVLADYKGLKPVYSFYEASGNLVKQHPKVLSALMREINTTSKWANQHRQEVNQILIRQLGLPQVVIDAWQKKVDYDVIPLNKQIIESQQAVADAFSKQHLIPRPVNVSQLFLLPESAHQNNRVEAVTGD